MDVWTCTVTDMYTGGGGGLIRLCRYIDSNMDVWTYTVAQTYAVTDI